jgi:pimeloyl-ACP methyl ester carboxylesterase
MEVTLTLRRPHPVPAIPTVVIVHGAWVDGTSWREVIARLHVKGLSVVAVQNPLSALQDDVDSVARVIKRHLGPVVLVGHGYGAPFAMLDAARYGHPTGGGSFCRIAQTSDRRAEARSLAREMCVRP